MSNIFYEFINLDKILIVDESNNFGEVKPHIQMNFSGTAFVTKNDQFIGILALSDADKFFSNTNINYSDRNKTPIKKMINHNPFTLGIEDIDDENVLTSLTCRTVPIVDREGSLVGVLQKRQPSQTNFRFLTEDEFKHSLTPFPKLHFSSKIPDLNDIYWLQFRG